MGDNQKLNLQPSKQTEPDKGTGQNKHGLGTLVTGGRGGGMEGKRRNYSLTHDVNANSVKLLRQLLLFANLYLNLTDQIQ